MQAQRHFHGLLALVRRATGAPASAISPRVFCWLLLGAVLAPVHAENWPQFRGPSGLGYSAERDLPLTWNAKSGENIAWKAALPKSNNAYSSPIAWGDRVFVTCVQNQPLEQRVLCFARADGKKLWETVVEPGPLILTDLRGGYGAPTPCTDGHRLYVVFGSAVIAALDFDGKLLWRKDIANHAFDVALGSSPILFKDTVILDCDQTGKTSSITAFHVANGEIKWDVKRPETSFAHTTPVIVTVASKPQMLVSATSALQGLDPMNGSLIWWCTAQGDSSSPAYGGGLVFSDSGRGGKAVCVDPTGMGDVSKTNVKWRVPQIPEGLASAIIVGDYVYRVHTPEILKCFNLATGDLVFSERLSGVSTWASPVATPDGRIYFASAGKSYVIKAGDKLEVLATNEIGEENRAMAAVSGGQIFLRGDKNLYCISKK
jgi:outer membrane protein assembly factor BamB